MGASNGYVHGAMIVAGIGAEATHLLCRHIVKSDDKLHEKETKGVKTAFIDHFFKPKQREEQEAVSQTTPDETNFNASSLA